MSQRSIGKYNSSITRVRPVFQNLIREFPSGNPWLKELLTLPADKNEIARRMADNPGILLDEVTRKRNYRDRVLLTYGVENISLEACFERSLPPPANFLTWLIQNPDQMSYREHASSKPETKALRRDLFGMNGSSRQTEVMKEALSQLDQNGAGESLRKWWAFEGFTEVDCYLETDSIILLIEGKRTEPLSSATMWFPQRNQIVRNLEVAHSVASIKGKQYGVMLLAEEPIELDIAEEAKKGLPHKSDQEISELCRHYLGCFDWKKVCEQTDLIFNALPDTTADVIGRLRT